MPNGKKRIATLVTDGVEEIELVSPRFILEEAGHTVEIIAPRAGKIQAYNHTDKGAILDVDRTLSDTDPDEYDAVFLPGGVINADQLRIDERAQAFVRRIDALRKPIFVICHASWLLVSAGLVRGRLMTSYPTLRDDIRNAGGDWIDQRVVVDRNWVSSRRPDDLDMFNREVLAMLETKKPAARTATAG